MAARSKLAYDRPVARRDLDPTNATVCRGECQGNNDYVSIELGERCSIETFLEPSCGSFPGSMAATSRRRWASSRAANATASILAKLLKSGGNVLLLDEPTNDLDVDNHAGAGRPRSPNSPAPPMVISSRPLVPRPHLHPHPRLRRRGPRGMVRGQLRGLRGRQEAAFGTRRSGTEANQV